MPDKENSRANEMLENRAAEPEVSVLNDKTVIEGTNLIVWLSGWATKIIFGLVSLIFLAGGFEHGRVHKVTFFLVTCGLGIVVTIASIIKLRARWMFLILPLSFVLFVSSCERPNLWPFEPLLRLGASSL